jgi:hypothetical protein
MLFMNRQKLSRLLIQINYDKTRKIGGSKKAIASAATKQSIVKMI